MAGDANTPRKVAAKLLAREIGSLKLTTGILVKATRAYKSAAQPDGAKQTEVASASGLTQPQISNFENGDFTPDDPKLTDALTACGFDLTKPGAAALQELIRFIRDKEGDLKQLEKELPD